jgi:hypothetical protein
MSRKALSWILVFLLASPGVRAADQPATDPEVLKGISLVEDGDYDAAIVTLDQAARRLAESKKQPSELSQAYLYLGIAYVGKGHEAAAKAKFKEALGQIRDLTLSPDRFPPKVINTFEEAKEEASKAAPAQAAATAPATKPSPPAEKKGGSGKILLIVGGVAAAGGIAAAAAGGGGSSSNSSAPPTTTQPADPRRVETFTGTICSYESRNSCAGAYYADYSIVVSAAGTLDANITWGDSNVLITMSLSDQNYQDVAQSNRATNTNSTLTSAVTPQTACPTCAYHLNLSRHDSLGPSDFTLTVRHP